MPEQESASTLAMNILLALVIWTPTAIQSQVLSVPVRWCVVGNDTNSNGIADPGEDGAVAFTSPSTLGEEDTDSVLWRRHERPSDATYLPLADITFRSALGAIVSDDSRNFPIVPDQDTSNSEHDIGDVLDHRIDNTEWLRTYQACVDAWSETLDTDDIGIVAVNVRRIVDEDGDPTFFAWAFSPSSRRVYLEDNSISFCGATEPSSTVCDGVDKTFGHEMGHSLGLRHTCDNSNMMRAGRRDTDGDGILDNFGLSDDIRQVTARGDDGNECTDDDTTSMIDQISRARDLAMAVPGCTLDGTNEACSSQSDLATDALLDVNEAFLDITVTRVTASKDLGITSFVHEVRGLLEGNIFGRFSELVYSFLIDLDNNESTGGLPSELGVPTSFQGAELVVLTTVTPPPPAGIDDPFLKSHLLLTEPRAWIFDAGSFEPVDSTGLSARIETIVSYGDTSEGTTEAHPVQDSVITDIPYRFFSATEGEFRTQALSVGVLRNNGGFTRDQLDEPGLVFRHEDPVFPLCQVIPSSAPRGGAVTTSATGLLPGESAHIYLGEAFVGNGTTDSTGNLDRSWSVPIDVSLGKHLVTVGIDGTALTADCFIEVSFLDCNDNGVDDRFDIGLGTSFDIDDSGIPDECEFRTVTWLISGTAEGGVVSFDIDSFGSICSFTFTTYPGQPASEVIEELASLVASDSCAQEAEISVRATEQALVVEGFQLVIDNQITDPGLLHSRPAIEVPTLSGWGKLLVIVMLMLLALSKNRQITKND